MKNVNIFSLFFNIQIDFSKKFSKIDHLFKQLLIKKINSSEKKTIKLSEVQITKHLKLPHGENFESFLKKFVSKTITVTYMSPTNEKNEMFFTIISSFIRENNLYFFTLSDEFFNIFSSEEHYLRKFNLDILLNFSSSASQNLFILLKSNQNLGRLELAIEDLRVILDSSDSYQRFYDFEKNILLPAIKDVKKFFMHGISYTKIKSSSSINSKVIKICFDFLNNQEKNIESLLSVIQPYCTNFNNIKSIIKKNFIKYDYSYIEKNMYYSILHERKNFDNFFISSLKYNYCDFRYENKIKKYLKSSYSVLSKFSGSFATVEEFRNFIFKDINNNKSLQSITLMINILKISLNVFNQIYTSENISKNEIYLSFYKNLEENNECVFENNLAIIIAEFNLKYSDSHFIIIKKS